MHVYSVNFFYRDASFMTPSQVFLCFQSSGLNTDISSKLQFYENSINYDQEIQQARNFIMVRYILLVSKSRQLNKVQNCNKT